MNFVTLPAHSGGLYLIHNEHRSFYEKLEDHLENIEAEFSVLTDDERKRALETDSIWKLQWYPDTPIGFYVVYAPTLEEVVRKALAISAQPIQDPPPS